MALISSMPKDSTLHCFHLMMLNFVTDDSNVQIDLGVEDPLSLPQVSLQP